MAMANAETRAIKIAFMEMPRMTVNPLPGDATLRASLKEFLLSNRRLSLEAKGPMNFGELFVGSSSPKLSLPRALPPLAARSETAQRTSL